MKRSSYKVPRYAVFSVLLLGPNRCVIAMRENSSLKRPSPLYCNAAGGTQKKQRKCTIFLVRTVIARMKDVDRTAAMKAISCISWEFSTKWLRKFRATLNMHHMYVSE